MLTSITPLGERGRGQRWAVTVVAYLVGSVLGGALVGALLGLAGSPVVGRLPEVAHLALAAAVCAAAALLDLRAVRRPGWRLPGGSRQVDEDWLTRYRGWVYGGAFGFQLGLGVVTIVTSAATYALLGLAVLSGGLLPGLVLGASFGLVRGAPVLALRGVHAPDQLREAARRLSERAAGTARAVVAVLALAAASLVVVAAGGAA